eukprot:jgi/Psemu1/237046/estExt_Genewise1.C_600084
MKNALLERIDTNNPHRNRFYFYPLAWIHWAFQLTYRECMFGIPGTGTRKDGWEGPLLKTNLDAVILLRYHALLFKIGLMVATLCLFVILPINMTAKCDPTVLGAISCMLHKSHRGGFRGTTIVNIPDKYYNENNFNVSQASIELSTSVIVTAIRGSAGITDSNSSDVDGGKEDSQLTDSRWLANEVWVKDQTWRIVATLICCLITYLYTFYLLTKEWVEVIALRRAFFLEGNHRKQRLRELNKLELEFFSKKRKHITHCQRTIPPFMTHPEIRETPPSVGMYSVLFKLPNCMITYDTDGANQVERQLVATTKFFDEVVPAMPGYDSSVVAATVIPDARLVAKVWNCWTACEKKLQTLRYINSLIAQAEQKLSTTAETQKKLRSPLLTTPTSADRQDVTAFENEPVNVTSLEVLEAGGDVEITTKDADTERMANVPSRASSIPPVKREFTYADFDVVKYAKSVGFSEEVDFMSDFVIGMGIEEFNVFTHSCAILAGGPKLEGTILSMYSVEKLKEEKDELIAELKTLQHQLACARADVVKTEDVELLEEEEHSCLLTAGRSEEGVLNRTSASGQNYLPNEWGITEREIQIMFPFSESSKSRQESTGKFQTFVLNLNRIMFGRENATFTPDIYGVKNDDGNAYKTHIGYPSYAVVTFMSRHSAIIARQCLADGVTDSWKQVDDIPIYPLADAPQLMWFPRGFMRPVTPTISFLSKKIRRWITYTFVILFTCFYIGIIDLVNEHIWNPDKVVALFGEAAQASLSKYSSSLSGLTQILLFSVCPVIFRIVANFEGSSTSMQKAEQRALMYFWYFYIIARFMGQIVYKSTLLFLRGEQGLENLVTGAINELAQTTPTELGRAALSYVIFSAFVSWPALYFLQANNFLTTVFRLNWINRLLKAGGPGPEVPYRIYVDSGYILACMTALAPVCPLIGPFALLYFIILAPMLRWLMIFAYRPKFDGGGDKWPELYHIVLTSLVLGQLMTGISFLSKGNIYEGLIVAFCVVPTLLYNSIIQDRFSRQFNDASLLQTGKIYNVRKSESGSMQEREEFRRFLVDCHKASYLPTCLSGGREDLITAQPASVVPTPEEEGNAGSKVAVSRRTSLERQKSQKGGSLRRQRYNI